MLEKVKQIMRFRIKFKYKWDIYRPVSFSLTLPLLSICSCYYYSQLLALKHKWEELLFISKKKAQITCLVSSLFKSCFVGHLRYITSFIPLTCCEVLGSMSYCNISLIIRRQICTLTKLTTIFSFPSVDYFIFVYQKYGIPYPGTLFCQIISVIGLGGCCYNTFRCCLPILYLISLVAKVLTNLFCQIGVCYLS